jgi:hypothetical protein
MFASLLLITCCLSLYPRYVTVEIVVLYYLFIRWKCQGVLYFFFDKGSFYKNTKCITSRGYKALVQAKCTQPDKRKKSQKSQLGTINPKTRSPPIRPEKRDRAHSHKELRPRYNQILKILPLEDSRTREPTSRQKDNLQRRVNSFSLKTKLFL